MHHHQTALGDRAEGLTTAFNAVHEQVQGLQAGIAEFATTQNETMNGFKEEMEAARALTTAFSDSISKLNIIGISTILDSFWTLTQGVGFVFVVVVVNWLAGKTAARIVATTCEYSGSAQHDCFADTNVAGFGLLSLNLARTLDMDIIAESLLGLLSQAVLLYGMVLLAVVGVCEGIRYACKLVSRSHKTRDRDNLLPSTSDNQRRPQAEFVEIKEEPIDLELQLDRSRTASPI